MYKDHKLIKKLNAKKNYIKIANSVSAPRYAIIKLKKKNEK